MQILDKSRIFKYTPSMGDSLSSKTIGMLTSLVVMLFVTTPADANKVLFNLWRESVDYRLPTQTELHALLDEHFAVLPQIMRMVDERGRVAHVSAVRIRERNTSPHQFSVYEVSFYVTQGFDDVGSVALITSAHIDGLYIQESARGRRLFLTLHLRDLNSPGLILPRRQLVLTTPYGDFGLFTGMAFAGPENLEFHRRVVEPHQSLPRYATELKRIRIEYLVPAPNCRYVM